MGQQLISIPLSYWDVCIPKDKCAWDCLTYCRVVSAQNSLSIFPVMRLSVMAGEQAARRENTHTHANLLSIASVSSTSRKSIFLKGEYLHVYGWIYTKIISETKSHFKHS